MFLARMKATVLFLSVAFVFTTIGVAAAEPLALLTHGSSGYINDAWFRQIDPDGSTGTGVIQPFLHIQANGIEQGYNTDFKPIEFRDASSPWTRSLPLSIVPIVTLNGIDYREFLLDINENTGNSNQFLSLDKLQIFLGDSPNLTNYSGGGLGTLVYDMDAGPSGDTWIELDYSLEAGSGGGDMLAYIPDNLFTDKDSYVYLYSMFGAQGTKANGMGSSDGFEEWSVRKYVNVPEPGSILVFSTGLVSMLSLRKRRNRK